MRRFGLLERRYAQYLAQFYLCAALALLGLYLVSGITFVQPGEVALVFRLGRLVGDTEEAAVVPPGLLLAWPAPIDQVMRIPAKREVSLDIVNFEPPAEGPPVNDASCRYALTGDESLVGVRMEVRYLITSPVEYARCADDVPELVQRVVVRRLQEGLNQLSLNEALQACRERYLLDQDTRNRLGLPNPARGQPNAPATPEYWTAPQLNAALEQSAIAKAHPELTATISAESRFVQNLADLVRAGAQADLQTLTCGVTLTSLTIHKVFPPTELQAVFEAYHTARIEQETTQSRSEALAQEALFDSQSIAMQAVAEAKGNREAISADLANQLALIRAEIDAGYSVSSGDVRERLRRQALQEVLQASKRNYFVPAASSNPVRIVLPAREESR